MILTFTTVRTSYFRYIVLFNEKQWVLVLNWELKTWSSHKPSGTDVVTGNFQSSSLIIGSVKPIK